MLTPFRVRELDAVDISLTGMRISLSAVAFNERPAELIAPFSQFTTALLVRLAPAANSNAGKAEPSSFNAPAAITVIVVAPVLVNAGSALPFNSASAVTTALPSSPVVITAFA